MLTLPQARQKAVRCLGQVADRHDPHAERRRARRDLTVGQLCAQFIERHAKPKCRTWREAESCLRRHLLPTLRGRLAASIEPADIEALHSELGRTAPYAANRFLALVRRLFNWGKLVGLVPADHANSAAGIVRFPERTRRRFITAAEMPRFLAALEGEDNDYARHALWLLLLCGLRSRELLNAKWTDVDRTAGTLFIGLTKNGEPLLAPLSDAGLERLKAIPRISENPYIICGQKPGRALTGLGEPLRRVVTRAGLQDIRVHDLRRTVGSWLAQSGVSLHLIGDILNHRDLKTTLSYAYFQTQHRREELNAHGGKILSFANASVRAGTIQAEWVTEELLQPETRPNKHRHYFKREALHDLVWTAPVTEIAERLGVSDVGLAKLCRRAVIPCPGRGYWARVEAGQHVPRTALPPPPRCLPELLRIRGRRPISMRPFLFG